MLDVRPTLYVIGWLIFFLGLTMIVPFLLNVYDGAAETSEFAKSICITVIMGVFLIFSCENSNKHQLSLQQTFLFTSGLWFVLPVFGALPFYFGAASLSATNALFESISALTTTGSTVITNLQELPRGTLLWRGMLQWFGGIGIIIVAMVFLPQLRVGGMQIFLSEGHDTTDKIFPKAIEIARSISILYIGLTALCALFYALAGAHPFDALVHGMTTVATGGFSNYDDSFASRSPLEEYIACIFMLAAALPFFKYVQLAGGSWRSFFKDQQVRAFLAVAGGLCTLLFAWYSIFIGQGEESIRKTLFNGVSILTGTGYSSTDYLRWGAFPIALLFFAGFIGGCAGSTTCSIKIFRFQILFAAIKMQLLRLRHPSAVSSLRYNGRKVDDDILASVIAFFMLFMISLGVFAVALGLTGLDFITSVSGAATALANIGPGLAPDIGPTGTFANLNDPAKWILCSAMLLGRLELMAVFVLFTHAFWRG